MTINVKEAGSYLDGTGKRYDLQAGGQEVSESLARRLVEVNPEAISLGGASQSSGQGQDQGGSEDVLS